MVHVEAVYKYSVTQIVMINNKPDADVFDNSKHYNWYNSGYYIQCTSAVMYNLFNIQAYINCYYVQ